METIVGLALLALVIKLAGEAIGAFFTWLER